MTTPSPPSGPPSDARAAPPGQRPGPAAPEGGQPGAAAPEGAQPDAAAPEALDYHGALALYQWMAEMGAADPLEEAPLDRYAAGAVPPPYVLPGDPAPQAGRAAPAGPGAPPRPADPGLPRPQRGAAGETARDGARTGALTGAHPPPGADDAPGALAAAAAAAAGSLEALAAAMEAFDLCELKRGARSFVFSDGTPAARVMIVGEAPGREEDLAGRPFVGQAGQLLDRMFAAIGLARAAPDPGRALYIANVLPWRPPGNREPEEAEVAMMRPFLERHIALADPDILVLMGNTACAGVLGRRGILRLRGQWTEALGRPVLPMAHPSYLLRNPPAKREAWADLLALAARLDTA